MARAPRVKRTPALVRAGAIAIEQTLPSLVFVEGADDGDVGGVGFEVVDGHVGVAGIAVGGAPAVFNDEVSAAGGGWDGGGVGVGGDVFVADVADDVDGVTADGVVLDAGGVADETVGGVDEIVGGVEAENDGVVEAERQENVIDGEILVVRIPSPSDAGG